MYCIFLAHSASCVVINLGFRSYGLVIFINEKDNKRDKDLIYIFFIQIEIFSIVPWKVACRNTVSLGRDVSGEEEGTCGFLRFLYEHNRGCGLSLVYLNTCKGVC